jgi:uncharacterized membrane protein
VPLIAPAKPAPVDKIGWIAILVGTAIIAWSGVLARFLDVGPLAGAAWRMGLAVPALAIWARLASGRAIGFAAPLGAPFLLLLAGLAFAADVGSFHIALTGTKVANASFIGNIAPILTVAGGALFFAEHPAPRVWIALALALFGSWAMAGMAAPSKLGFGDVFALCASIAYACYLLVIKRVRAARRAHRDALVGGGLGGRARHRRDAARRDLAAAQRTGLDDRHPARRRFARHGTRLDLGCGRSGFRRLARPRHSRPTSFLCAPGVVGAR